MRIPFSEQVEAGRAVNVIGLPKTNPGDDYGCFRFRAPSGIWLNCVVSSGDPEVGIKWEHVSVSTPTRCPTWDEMDWIKRLFWNDEEIVQQFHVNDSRKTNQHPYCLHLWKPIGKDVELPPRICV